MPKLIKLYIVNVAIGFGISALFLGLVLALDLAHLRHLVLETPSGWIGGMLFFLSNGIVFAGVQFAIAVMSLAEDDNQGPRGGIRQLLHLVPAKVTAPASANAGTKSRL
jgi:hypothetical protein